MVDLPDEVKNMTTTPTPALARPEGTGSRAALGARPPRRDGDPEGERPGGSRGPSGRSGGRSGGPSGGRRPFQRRRRRLFGGGKVCQLCARKIAHLDYKDLDQLRFFVSNHGKILPRRLSGACAKHQRLVTTAVKRARQIALLPFKG